MHQTGIWDVAERSRIHAVEIKCVRGIYLWCKWDADSNEDKHGRLSNMGGTVSGDWELIAKWLNG